MGETITKVTLFSDGSSRGNPGPGGYGTILRYVDPSGQVHEREYSGGFPETTNNRMELMGVIVGLENLTKPCHVHIVSDSQYVVKAFNEHWIENWIRKGRLESGTNQVKNADLWKRLLSAGEKHKLTFTWIKGHASHPENERCDALATGAADRVREEQGRN